MKAQRDVASTEIDPTLASAPGAAARVSAPHRVALPLVTAIATLILTYWCVDIVSPALPEIQRALALSGTGAGLVFALFFGGRLITNLPAAILVDRVGPRWTAATGAAALLSGSALAALATSPTSLLPARGLQGIGVALLATAGLLSILRALPGGGAAMTAFNIATGVGGSAGLISGGWLTDAISWRAIFWLSAGLGGVLLVGIVLSGHRAASAPRRDDQAAPATPVSSSRALVGALAANLLVYSNYSIWVVSLSLYATERFAANAERIGFTLLVINAIHLLAAVPAGGLIRRVGALPALATGFSLTATGLACVLLAPSQGWVLAPMALYAIGQVVSNSAAGDLLLRLGGHGGRAVGLVRLTSDIGLVAGPTAVGILADTAGVQAPFVALAIATGVGAAVAWRSVRRSMVTT